MGASAMKRDAKRKATKAYYDNLQKFDRLDEVKNIDTQGTRKLDEQLGGEMGVHSKSLARKADKLGRQINQESKPFNETVDKYNKRYDALQDQLKSPTGTEKGVDYAYNLEPKMRQEFSRIDSEIDALRKEEAAYASKKPVIATTGFGGMKPQPLDDSQIARAKRIQDLQEERDFIDRSSRGLNESYRNLDNLKLANDEMTTLAMEVQGYKPKAQPAATATPFGGMPSGMPGGIGSQQSDPQSDLRSALSPTPNSAWNITPPVNKFDPQNMELDPNSAGARMSKFGSQYQAIADKLNKSVAHDARMADGSDQPANPTGLLASSMVIDPNSNPVATA